MGFWKRLLHAAAPRIGAAADYDAASGTRRVAGWAPVTSDVNTLVFRNADTLRSRARDMVRRNPWATNALDAFVGNCVGTGIKPQALNLDPRMKEQIQALWLRWTDEADASGVTDFYGLQALACRAVMEAGECFIRLRSRLPKDGLSVPLQLQLIEAEHLPTGETRKLPNGNYIRAGIEFNGIGRRVAYHLHREHPGDALNPMFSTELVRVPADYVLHLFRPLRPGQLRGQPWLTQVLIKLYELDQYDDAELVRKKTAAMFAGFVTKNAPEDQILGESSPDANGVVLSGLEPGTLQVLLPGEDVKFSTPADVGASYETFMRVQLRSIAAGMGITYEQLTGDLTGVNYSSIRAGLLEFRRRCEQFQHQVMVFQMCRPIWQRWIRDAILSGALKLAADQSGSLEAKWIPPGFAWVDPLKDIKAQIMAVRAGFKSRSEVVSEQGYDAETIDREIAGDNARADALGLAYESDPRKESNESSTPSGNADL
ncbi:MAG TPA: phage portal protein [Bryobacteraceae bacterium]|nr:phage portal protein [Bryobacteraceae bacterium]